MFRVCVDVGGTFTDCLVLDGSSGDLRMFKAPTTQPDPSLGFGAALEKAAAGFGRDVRGFLADVDLIIHGTTLATNTLINKNGAKTGMITTKGFRDVIEIRKGHKNVRTSMYDVFLPPYKPLVKRRHRLEVPERTIEDGTITTPLDVEAVRDAACKLKAAGIESLVIGFLHSYANPTNERRAAEVARESLDGVYIATSSDILPVWREWERFNTTVVSAYVGPVIERYLRALTARLAESGFRGHLLLMLSSGVVGTVDYCIPRAVQLIGSGPAAAPAGAIHLGERVGSSDLVSIDMGGTSLDVCLIRGGEIPNTTEGWVEDERVGIKLVDIQSAGAGGGSIAWVDSLGLLRVGPQSAGGSPGPACYGRGGERPTVTDADLLLGYVPADFFLGGEIPLDPTLATKAMEEVAKPLGMSAHEAARAVFTTVNAFMADQITEVSTKRGLDVRDLTLVGGGGAGPVHAAFIADHLHIPRVVIPPIAGTYSAFGMFAMDVGRDFARSYITRIANIDHARANALYEEMEREARAAFAALGVAPEQVTVRRSVDARYIGQFTEVEVAMPGGTVSPESVDSALQAFHERHLQLYTFNMPWKGVEFLTFRLRATVPKIPFELRRVERGTADASKALKRSRRAWFDGGEIDAPVYDGAKLRSGNVIQGPALIEETTTSVVIPSNYRCTVDDWRNFVLARTGGA